MGLCLFPKTKRGLKRIKKSTESSRPLRSRGSIQSYMLFNVQCIDPLCSDGQKRVKMAPIEIEKAKKNRHPTFQPGHPRQYYSGSNALSFGERTGSGVFHVEVADSGNYVDLDF